MYDYWKLLFVFYFNIVARAEGEEQIMQLYEDGVYMAVLPEMEAGLEIARQAHLHLDVPITSIQQFTDDVRQQMYGPIYDSEPDFQLMEKLDTIKYQLEIGWAKVDKNSPFIHKTLMETAVRNITGVSVVGVIRNGIFVPNPKGDYRFTPGDLVAVVGSKQERDHFQLLAENGNI